MLSANYNVQKQKIVRLVQARSFEDELKMVRSVQKDKTRKRKGQLWRLDPFVDEDGVLRVGGRLVNAQEEDAFRFPAVA